MRTLVIDANPLHAMSEFVEGEFGAPRWLQLRAHEVQRLGITAQFSVPQGVAIEKIEVASLRALSRRNLKARVSLAHLEREALPLLPSWKPPVKNGVFVDPTGNVSDVPFHDVEDLESGTQNPRGSLTRIDNVDWKRFGDDTAAAAAKRWTILQQVRRQYPDNWKEKASERGYMVLPEDPFLVSNQQEATDVSRQCPIFVDAVVAGGRWYQPDGKEELWEGKPSRVPVLHWRRMVAELIRQQPPSALIALFSCYV